MTSQRIAILNEAIDSTKTQSQARWQLDNWERYIVGNWSKWSFVMQDISMYQRKRLLKQLLKLQLKEFER